MKCLKCGQESTGKFCTGCGQPLTGENNFSLNNRPQHPYQQQPYQQQSPPNPINQHQQYQQYQSAPQMAQVPTSVKRDLKWWQVLLIVLGVVVIVPSVIVGIANSGSGANDSIDINATQSDDTTSESIEAIIPKKSSEDVFSSEPAEQSKPKQSEPIKKQEEKNKPQSKSVTTSDTTVKKESNTTTGQKNALRKANQYLEFMAFSHSGLVEQLEYEGFSNDEATYAVNNCGANWNLQASKKAKSYLEFMAFSREGLIEQLIFDGYTSEQATYGADQNGY